MSARGNTVSAKSAKRIPVSIVAAVSLDLLLSFIDGLEPIMTVLLLVPSFLFAYLMMELLTMNNALHLRRLFYDGVVAALRKILYFRSRGMSLFKALLNVSRSENDERIRNFFAEASRKSEMGCSFIDAVESNTEAKAFGLIRNIGRHACGSDADFASISAEYDIDSEKKKSEIESSIQTYATLNMFISTIAPSMAVFAFVGSAILSSTGLSMLLFSFTMLFLMPSIYAVGNLMMKRRLSE